MTYLAKLKAIKCIMDEMFVKKTPLKDIEITRCEEHDNIIYSASVYDHGCEVIVRLDRNADGTYAMKQYCW